MLISEEEKAMLKLVVEECQIQSHMGYHNVKDAVQTYYPSCRFCQKLGTATVSSGVTKYCMVFTNFPWVIKWARPRRTDEPMREVKIYAEAEKENLGQFFPRTEFLCKINDISFVIQEKIDFPAYSIPVHEWKKYAKITRTVKTEIANKIEKEFYKVSGYRRPLNTLWAKMAISLYGKKACKSLCQFVVKFDINDLHEANIGYKEHRPVILDFSGFHDT